MKAVYKYNLEIKDYQVLSIPKHGEFLDFQNQNDKITFWVEVETENLLMSDEEFYIVGTGNEIPFAANYYHGTVQINNSVWHIYQNSY